MQADYIAILGILGVLSSKEETDRARAVIEEVLQGMTEDFAQEYIFRNGDEASRLRMQCAALQTGEVRAVISHTLLASVPQEKIDGCPGGHRDEHIAWQKEQMREEAAGRFTAGIAHEFNNILAAIIGYSELALFNLPPESRAIDHLSGVLQAGRRARDLARQLLLFSREKEDDRRPLPLAAVISEALSFFRSSLPGNIAISEDLGHAPAIVHGDKRQIQQMLVHLCDSIANTMTDKGGIIALSLQRVDGAGPPSICRQMPGDGKFFLALNISKKIFGVAAKNDPALLEMELSPHTTGGEAGLGMACDIAANHQGRITITRSSGEIEQITVYLPVYEESVPEKGANEAKTPVHGKGHILIIDDEASLIKVTSENLRSLGYSVTSRLCGKEALELFQSTPEQFDLVISDLAMPEITGDKLAARLIEVRPDIPIIIYTGYRTPELEQKASRLGVRAVLEKPSSRGELAMLVQTVLAGRQPLTFSSEDKPLQ
jgi:CheY-like chemotaxis protein/signal transduction histidine kinase